MTEFKFHAVEYVERRLEFFQEQKAAALRKLEYWASPARKQDWRRIEDECSACGDAIAFYNDAVRAFGGVADD